MPRFAPRARRPFIRNPRPARAPAAPSLDPLQALALIGAPAGGKGYMKSEIAGFSGVGGLDKVAAVGSGTVDLTVDQIRSDIHNRSAQQQVDLFKRAAEAEPHWGQIVEPWQGIRRQLDVGRKPTDIVASLDDYGDYIGICRFEQRERLNSAMANKQHVLLDETGAGPSLVLNPLEKLHNRGYHTTVVMNHHPDVGTNLLQNVQRMATGSDCGRDSTPAIAGGWGRLDKAWGTYTKAASKVAELPMSDMGAIERFLRSQAKAGDSKHSVDVLLKAYNNDTLDQTYRRIHKSLTPRQKRAFDALLLLKCDARGYNGVGPAERVNPGVGARLRELVPTDTRRAYRDLRMLHSRGVGSINAERQGDRRYQQWRDGKYVGGITDEVVATARRTWRR